MVLTGNELKSMRTQTQNILTIYSYQNLCTKSGKSLLILLDDIQLVVKNKHSLPWETPLFALCTGNIQSDFKA